MPNLRTHPPLLATDFAAAFTGFLGTHTVLRIRVEKDEPVILGTEPTPSQGVFSPLSWRNNNIASGGDGYSNRVGSRFSWRTKNHARSGKGSAARKNDSRPSRVNLEVGPAWQVGPTPLPTIQPLSRSRQSIPDEDAKASSKACVPLFA